MYVKSTKICENCVTYSLNKTLDLLYELKRNSSHTKLHTEKRHLDSLRLDLLSLLSIHLASGVTQLPGK